MACLYMFTDEEPTDPEGNSLADPIPNGLTVFVFLPDRANHRLPRNMGVEGHAQGVVNGGDDAWGRL